MSRALSAFRESLVWNGNHLDTNETVQDTVVGFCPLRKEEALCFVVVVEKKEQRTINTGLDCVASRDGCDWARAVQS